MVEQRGFLQCSQAPRRSFFRFSKSRGLIPSCPASQNQLQTTKPSVPGWTMTTCMAQVLHRCPISPLTSGILRAVPVVGPQNNLTRTVSCRPVNILILSVTAIWHSTNRRVHKHPISCQKSRITASQTSHRVSRKGRNRPHQSRSKDPSSSSGFPAFLCGRCLHNVGCSMSDVRYLPPSA